MINGAHEIIKNLNIFLVNLHSSFLFFVFYSWIFGNIHVHIRRAQRLKHCACSILYMFGQHWARKYQIIL